jgi:putative glutamine amidotransferase
MSRPLIGLACLSLQSQASPPRFAANQRYVQAIEAAGGAPLLIPLLDDEIALRSIYQSLTGLLLPGGADLDPRLYGEAPHPKLGPLDVAMDRVELLLLGWALADDRPVLGICRGQQTLNVGLGGNLYQDLPGQFGRSIDHRASREERPRLVHEIEVRPETRLAAIIGPGRRMVNSLHHQGVKDVAPGLLASAHSPDGLVEGLESPEHRFVLSMQCHPEELYEQHDWAMALFRAFVAACQSAT